MIANLNVPTINFDVKMTTCMLYAILLPRALRRSTLKCCPVSGL
jgi:hypothetical protein